MSESFKDILREKPWPVEEETDDDIVYFRRLDEALKNEARQLRDKAETRK